MDLAQYFTFGFLFAMIQIVQIRTWHINMFSFTLCAHVVRMFPQKPMLAIICTVPMCSRNDSNAHCMTYH